MTNPLPTRPRCRFPASPKCYIFDSSTRIIFKGLKRFLSKKYFAIWFFLAIAAASTGSWAFDLQGHRGARGLAPENTLAAFRRALAVGVTTLELDIAVTADGVVVVSHDPYLNPFITRDTREAGGQWLTGSRGPLIRSLTLAQLQYFDLGRINPATAYAAQFPAQMAHDGERMPTLAAVFDLVKAEGADEVRFNIETKISPLEPEASVSPDAMTQALLEVVRTSAMQSRVMVQSFDWRSLKRVQALEPRMPTACLSSQSADGNTLQTGQWTAGLRLADFESVPGMVKAAGCSTWSPNQGALSEAAVKQAHEHGLQVLPWTVNAEPDMKRLIGWGVDGIITDYPDRLRRVMAKHAMSVPLAVPIK